MSRVTPLSARPIVSAYRHDHPQLNGPTIQSWERPSGCANGRLEILATQAFISVANPQRLIAHIATSIVRWRIAAKTTTRPDTEDRYTSRSNQGFSTCPLRIVSASLISSNNDYAAAAVFSDGMLSRAERIALIGSGFACAVSLRHRRQARAPGNPWKRPNI